MKATTRFKTWAPRLLFVGLGFGAIAATFAVRALFDRPGETALRFVPADALVVGSIDLSPSPEQTVTFKNIEDALQRNGQKDSIEKSMLDVIEHSPQAAGLRELTTRSVAGCLLPSNEKKGDTGGVLLFPVTDGDAATKILQQKGREEFWRGTRFFRLPHSTTGMYVKSSTLVVSDQPWAIHKIADVMSGQSPSILTNDEYRQARAKAPTDANLVCLVSPKMAEMAGKGSSPVTGEWGAFSLRIEDGGLNFEAVGNLDVSKDEAFRRVAEGAPLRKDLLNVLPPNAYGLMAAAQLSRAFDAAETSSRGTNADKPLGDFEQSIEKETGISVKNDFVPAFEGDSVIGIYPSQEPVAGVDLLVLVDNKNGADPEDLAKKLQAYVDKQALSKGGLGKNWFTKIDRADATEFRISDKLQSDMRKSMTEDPGALRGDVLFGKKTVAWARVDGAVLLATSQDLLDKAISTYEGKSASLSGDALVGAPADPGDSSREILVLSPARIVEGILNTTDESKMDKQSLGLFQNFIGAFKDLKDPLSVKVGLASDGSGKVKVFIPLDYVKLIDAVGKANRSAP